MRVKGYQQQGKGHKWKIETEINSFCDMHAERARKVNHQGKANPFSPKPVVQDKYW